MRYTGRYNQTEDNYDLQGELDNRIQDLSNAIDKIDSDGIKNNKVEILKGMINYLIEEL